MDNKCKKCMQELEIIYKNLILKKNLYERLKLSKSAVISLLALLLFIFIFGSCWKNGIKLFEEHMICCTILLYISYQLLNTIKKSSNDSKNYIANINNTKQHLKDKLEHQFEYITEYISDLETVDYDIISSYLDTKKHPAHKKAQDVRELKQKTKEYIKQYKQMRYEYDMLFSLFPELEDYLEYYSPVLSNEDKNIEEIKENYDYVRSWVTKDEYKKLEENKRNQLALDRYIESRKKSKWNIGRDYEMYIGNWYESLGYKITYTGIMERLEDKGRDLIAKKDNEVLIIQCKNWSKNKIIHENHICQLFGTTTQYNIENDLQTKAKSVFVTTTELSDTALKFAKYLNIQIIQNKQFEEFPRIKCNIGKNNEKIYHLPFDQQYDRTIIDQEKGEFFAWTVEEAVSQGFRRAKKYMFNKE